MNESQPDSATEVIIARIVARIDDLESKLNERWEIEDCRKERMKWIESGLTVLGIGAAVFTLAILVSGIFQPENDSIVWVLVVASFAAVMWGLVFSAYGVWRSWR